MNVYFVQYECIPIEGSENEARYGGAVVNGWIKATNVDNARAIYEDSIHRLGWNAVKFEGAFELSEDSYEEKDEEGLRYLKQAMAEGEVFEAHAWSSDPDIGRTNH